MNEKFSSKEQRDEIICKLYIDGYNSVYINKYLNITNSQVLHVLHKYNITIRDRHACQKKHKANESYFNVIDSFEKAYWLGFISGDGCVCKNSLAITLSDKDEIILKEFKKDINCTQPIIYWKANNSFAKKDTRFCNITITSCEMLQDLLKYGIVNRKSKTLQIKNIPAEYENGFILGLIDADGCFRVNKLGNVSLSLIANIDLAKYVQDILIKNCNLNRTKLIEHHSTKEMVYLEYAGNKQMQRIYNFLYSDSKFYLPRKHDRIIQCFKKKLPNKDQTER